MALTRRNNQYYREVPMDPGIVYAAETPTASLFAVHRDGRVMVDDVELSDADSLALHDYTSEFHGYPVPHSGVADSVVESGGYVTAAWMGAAPDISWGTPIYIGVRRSTGETVRHLLHFAGHVLDHNPKTRRGIDNHCFPQLFLRDSDKRLVYLGGGHHTTLYAGVSGSPHAGFNFHRLHPVGPESSTPLCSHTYPAARLVGDTLHVVSRFTTDGYQFHLAYWTVDTLTMQTRPTTILDKAPDGHKYAIWYQQPRVEGDKLIIDTSRRWSNTGTVADLTDPEPKTYEVAI